MGKTGNETDHLALTQRSCLSKNAKFSQRNCLITQQLVQGSFGMVLQHKSLHVCVTSTVQHHIFVLNIGSKVDT